VTAAVSVGMATNVGAQAGMRAATVVTDKAILVVGVRLSRPAGSPLAIVTSDAVKADPADGGNAEGRR